MDDKKTWYKCPFDNNYFSEDKNGEELYKVHLRAHFAAEDPHDLAATREEVARLRACESALDGLRDLYDVVAAAKARVETDLKQMTNRALEAEKRIGTADADRGTAVTVARALKDDLNAANQKCVEQAAKIEELQKKLGDWVGHAGEETERANRAELNCTLARRERDRALEGEVKAIDRAEELQKEVSVLRSAGHFTARALAADVNHSHWQFDADQKRLQHQDERITALEKWIGDRDFGFGAEVNARNRSCK